MERYQKYVAWFCVVMAGISLILGIWFACLGFTLPVISLFLSTVTFVLNAIILFR